MSGHTPYSQPSSPDKDTATALGKQVHAALWALKAGNPAQARTILEKVAQANAMEPGWTVALALACRDMEDNAASMAWVDKALDADPEHIRGGLLKAELLAKSGRAQDAASYYLSIVRRAGDANGAPPEIREELRRARAFCDGLAKTVESTIRDHLRGHDAGDRFTESIDLLLGKRKPYFSQPTYYYYPGLPHRAFFGADEFSFVPVLEDATSGIREELLALLDDSNAFEPYVRSSESRPKNAQGGMADNPAWGAYFFWKDGMPVHDHLVRCPKTAAAIARLPLCDIPGRSPNVLFSRLLPGAHIPAHHGFLNVRLIGHLPLIAPPGCRFRVGNDVREWREGKAWLFDDTFEHEAWNNSTQTRVILLFEIWRPELSESERQAIRTLFSALDSVPGGAPRWDD